MWTTCFYIQTLQESSHFFFKKSICISGVHRYTIEGRLGCSIDWFHDEIYSTLYNVTIFTGSFFIPAAIIVSTNAVIFYSVILSISNVFNIDELYAVFAKIAAYFIATESWV